jgi:hypothetical protein
MALYVTVSHPHVKKKTHTQNGSIPGKTSIFCQCPLLLCFKTMPI